MSQDKNTGHGGSYIVDKETGERRLIERTEDKRDDAHVESEKTPATAPDKTSDKQESPDA